MHYTMGFDIGGTNIAAGLVDEQARIIRRAVMPYPIGKGHEAAALLVAQMADKLTADEGVGMDKISGVGVAVPGSLDSRCKVVINAYNLQLRNAPFYDCLAGYFPNTPLYLMNDANAAAAAELYAGALKGCKTAALVTLGTGVGGGLILNGKVFNGGNGSGVELGHMILQYGGELCTCGIRGCVEAYCTATWLIKEGRRAVVERFNSRIATEAGGDMDNVTAKLVMDCAKAGDTIALDIFGRFVERLAGALLSIIHLLDPEVIAVGGGVGLAGDFLFSALRERIGEKCFFKSFARIVPAAMGNDAGIIGAAIYGGHLRQ